ncbi:class II glutamine amidotransferase [Acidithiobacillus caldus]|uniref:glutamine--fructose-6-phosphate transaminase (isomerizing) n=2 Tax=Acidithiobacillus caldus TaxID=33059 RepID=A0A060A3M1_ACICK|nr:class II glutamine amidotransferase [Acidithiobacillus caldus]AIA56761.1 Glutamine amidotransferase protein GlxB [Acidithiobacillus caldus ATCC 51756]MBU2731131.1 amidophosphoribosyltransferase [Acidithiobacillus caldus]MBU2735978.1 amidophosphoribosyltransferase [Acidithiobacillus caldus ATCC 51756]MBU2744224.1 amidophosphoribosyltransferase [Acidithiobacillus caldus]
MCGIVGLLIKKEELYPQLGGWMLPMLQGMTERGPDSAGVAVFIDNVSEAQSQISLYVGQAAGYGWAALAKRMEDDLQTRVTIQSCANHAILQSDIQATQKIQSWVRDNAPEVQMLALGHRMIVYKDVGRPAEVADRYALGTVQGSHLVAHTRMATESAVTPDRAHPFTAGKDFCLVHNGSLSNPYSLRRTLEAEGIVFATDNDTEAACRFLEWRLREGDTLEAAIEKSFSALDGFFTFLMGTTDEMALVRDPFACKPAVVAETSDYVAIASEFRALAHLPDIDHAHVFEPAPEEIYLWKV